LAVRLLLRLYFDALFKGNPFVVAITAIGVLAVSIGPFYRGVASRDPAAIGLSALVLLGILLLLAVVIIDRRSNRPKGGGREPKRSGRR
jgi:hypothetical protein